MSLGNCDGKDFRRKWKVFGLDAQSPGTRRSVFCRSWPCHQERHASGLRVTQGSSPRGHSRQGGQRMDALRDGSCPRVDEGTRPAREVSRRSSDGALSRALGVLRVWGGGSGQSQGSRPRLWGGEDSLPHAASPGHCAFGLTYVSERGVTLFVNEGAGAQAW